VCVYAQCSVYMSVPSLLSPRSPGARLPLLCSQDLFVIAAAALSLFACTSARPCRSNVHTYAPCLCVCLGLRGSINGWSFTHFFMYVMYGLYVPGAAWLLWTIGTAFEFLESAAEHYEYSSGLGHSTCNVCL